MLIVFRSNWTTDSIYGRMGFKAKLEQGLDISHYDIAYVQFSVFIFTNQNTTTMI